MDKGAGHTEQTEEGAAGGTAGRMGGFLAHPPVWVLACHCAGWAGGLQEAAVRMGQTLPSSAAWPGSCPLGGRVPTGEGSQALCLLALVPCPDPRAALPTPHGRGSLTPTW